MCQVSQHFLSYLNACIETIVMNLDSLQLRNVLLLSDIEIKSKFTCIIYMLMASKIEVGVQIEYIGLEHSETDNLKWRKVGITRFQ